MNNARESWKEIEKGGAILPMNKAIESTKETGKGGKILLMNNARESRKEKGKGDKISLKSNGRMNEREQEKIDVELYEIYCVYVIMAQHFYHFDFKLTSDAKIQPVI